MLSSAKYWQFASWIWWVTRWVAGRSKPGEKRRNPVAGGIWKTGEVRMVDQKGNWWKGGKDGRMDGETLRNCKKRAAPAGGRMGGRVPNPRFFWRHRVCDVILARRPWYVNGLRNCGMRFYLIDLMYVNEWGPRAHADLTPSLIRRLYNLPLSPPTATHCFKFTHRHPLAPPYGMNSPAVPLWHHPLLCTHPPPPTGTTRCCVFTRCCL